MKNKAIGFLLILFISGSASAGGKNDSTRRKYIGFDANPLLSQILPFNRLTIDGNSFGIMNRRYWGRGGIRTLYGGQLTSNGKLQFITFEIGYDNRRKINKRWLFFSGFDGSIHLQDNDVTNTSFEFGSGLLVGFGGHWGIEYKFDNVVSISTESRLRLMLDVDEGPLIQLTAPFTFAVHFDITKFR